jgi:cell division protein FtsQ
MNRRRNSTARGSRLQIFAKTWQALLQFPWRRWLPAAVAAGIALLVFGALRVALNQPLERIAVEGRFQRVSPIDVEKAVRGVVEGKGLVAVDLKQVQVAVESIDWVDHARVGRSWPRGLTVLVQEQRPVARWGETGLVNVRGELFVNDARHIPAELPELIGPLGTHSLMTDRYLKTQGRLVQSGFRLQQLKLDARGAWELQLDNGVAVRLGRAHVDQRFDRFMTVASRTVAARVAEIAYVDLRYANGFAVGWRSQNQKRTTNRG